MLIAFDKDYDLENTLLSGQAFRWERPDADGWLTGVIFDNIVRMRRVTEGVEFVCSSDDEDALYPRIVDYLRLSDDLDSIKASINKDEHIDAAIAQSPGLHILRQEPWECMVSFICSQRSNIPKIRRNVKDIADAFGSPIMLGDLRRSTFPSPAALAEAGEEQLRELKLGYRAEYVAAAAQQVAEWDFDLYQLRDLMRLVPYSSALNGLTIRFDGVGDKVGDCVLLYALDKLDAFPVDGHIEDALRDCYPEMEEVAARKLSLQTRRRKMRQWAQDYFGEYAGYAQHWLFYSRPKGS